MEEPTMEMLKTSLRIDGDEDDQMLRVFLDAAAGFVSDAIACDDPDFFKQDKVADLFSTAVLAQASAYYNNRSATSPTQVFTVDSPMNSIVGQLRGAYARYKEVQDNGKTDQSSAPQVSN